MSGSDSGSGSGFSDQSNAIVSQALIAGAVAIIVIGGSAIAISGLPQTKKTLQNVAETVQHKEVEFNTNRQIEQAGENIRAHETDATAWAERGRLLSENGQYGEAVKDYSQAIKLKPNEASYYFLRGFDLDRVQQTNRAVADYTRGIELDPKNAAAYSQRALFYSTLDKSEAAFDDYTKALELTDSDADRLFYKGQRATLLSGLATQYEVDRNYPKALAVLARWIKLEPDDQTALVQRAQLYEEMKLPQKAKEDYAKALKVGSIQNPETYADYEQQGDLYQKLGNLDAAKNSWRSAIALLQDDEKDTDSFFYQSGDVILNYDGMVLLYEKIGDAEGAAEIRKKQLQIHQERIQDSPQEPRCYAGRAATYEAMHDYKAALADYSTAIKLQPEAETYRLRAEIFFQQKEYQLAVDDLEKCLISAQEEHKSEDCVKLAKLFELLGRHEDALKAANQSIAADATAADGYYWRARAEKSQGKNTEAASDFKKARGLRPLCDPLAECGLLQMK